MQRDWINSELEKRAFEFFFRFSKFEYALKMGGYLKSKKIGSNAEPNWDDFVKKHFGGFKVSVESKKLIELAPMRQKIATEDRLEWKAVGLENDPTELGKVVRYLKAVRNNLFHGGKFDENKWEDNKRNRELIEVCNVILNELANLADIYPHYSGEY